MSLRTDPQRNRLLGIGLALLLAGVVIGWVARGDGGSSTAAVSTSIGAAATNAPLVTDGSAVTDQPTDASTNPTQGQQPGTDGTTGTVDANCPAIRGADSVSTDQLPSQALDTLDLIATDGPFPYDQDGAVFQNRERVLPKRSAGYYHEYTVITPGSPDRGARRIIVGDCGDKWYTDDHYESFRLITDA